MRPNAVIIPADWKSWVSVPAGSDFPIQNLPFGIAVPTGDSPRAAMAIGEEVVDLLRVWDAGLLQGVSGLEREDLAAPVLNRLIGKGRAVTGGLRARVAELLREGNTELQGKGALHARAAVRLLLPVEIGDYSDFYSSIEHATNVGIMFRGKENALMPNWRHIPIGYHGRSGSIVVSGTDVHRPYGQTMPDGAESPVFGPSKQMDFELEVGFIVGRETKLGERVKVEEAEEYIFGLLLFNDWTARDIQKWEYQPLGPFLGKNFASTVSPWIVTLDALEPFRTAGPVQEPAPLPNLALGGAHNFDIQLHVILQPEGQPETVISRSNFRYMYWNMAQQLAHHTSNGCNIRVGDLYASGTISGPEESSYGSMLELAWKGTKPIPMAGGGERKFIQDHDRLTLRGFCEKDGLRIGFGESTGKLLPVRD